MYLEMINNGQSNRSLIYPFIEYTLALYILDTLYVLKDCEDRKIAQDPCSEAVHRVKENLMTTEEESK